MARISNSLPDRPNDPEPYQFWDLGSWITAIVGSVILLFLVGLVMGRRRV